MQWARFGFPSFHIYNYNKTSAKSHALRIDPFFSASKSATAGLFPKKSNSDVNASEMLLEENLKKLLRNTNEHPKEIKIKEPDSCDPPDNVDSEIVVDEPNLLARAEIPPSSLAEEAQGGDSTNAPLIDGPQKYQTRSGRTVRPPRPTSASETECVNKVEISVKI